jgi:hypothetical protein
MAVTRGTTFSTPARSAINPSPVGSNRSPRKRNRSLEACASKFRIDGGAALGDRCVRRAARSLPDREQKVGISSAGSSACALARARDRAGDDRHVGPRERGEVGDDRVVGAVLEQAALRRGRDDGARRGEVGEQARERRSVVPVAGVVVELDLEPMQRPPRAR